MDIKHNGQWKIAKNKVHIFFFFFLELSILLQLFENEYYFGKSLFLYLFDALYQSPCRVVIRYSHHTPLQWAKLQNLFKPRKTCFITA